jgi:glutathione S-transferase
MKLHAHKVSTTSRMILLFLAESKLECPLVVVDLMTGEHVNEPYATFNPSKQVPVLEDGDFVLTESSSILKYLADSCNSPAYPKDLKQRTRINEMMDWLNTGFYREWGYHLIYPQVFPHHKRSPEAAQQTTLEWGKTQSEFWLSVLDKHWLGKGNKYLCGNQITIADYFGGEMVGLGDVIGVKLGKYPNVTKWMNTMRALPSWKSVNDVFAGFVDAVKGKSYVTIS